MASCFIGFWGFIFIYLSVMVSSLCLRVCLDLGVVFMMLFFFVFADICAYVHSLCVFLVSVLLVVLFFFNFVICFFFLFFRD